MGEFCGFEGDECRRGERERGLPTVECINIGRPDGTSRYSAVEVGSLRAGS